MEWNTLDPLFAWILRASLATLFGAAAAHKLSDPRRFVQTMMEYKLVPDRFAALGAFCLVAAEGLVATGLLIGDFTREAGLAGAALLLTYSAAIGINLLRGRREIDCGCFGPAKRQPLSSWLLYRNLILGLAAIVACLPVSARPLNFVDGISFLGGFATLVLLFNGINFLAAEPNTWTRQEHAS
jgi:hypothetical protein